MSKGHRTKYKKERNAEKDTRPKAHARYVRLSSIKAKPVLQLIRGKSYHTAKAILTYSPRYASSVILKVLNSAAANAEANLGMNVDDLIVEEAVANQGPTMKRIKPRSHGRADRIEKKTSHISIILNER
jgi:large subunit ribosomal protein L22